MSRASAVERAARRLEAAGARIRDELLATGAVSPASRRAYLTALLAGVAELLAESVSTSELLAKRERPC
ncbi:MAG: hypothetical protein ACOY3Y_03895 [Acidobacteriota bacterium]